MSIGNVCLNLTTFTYALTTNRAKCKRGLATSRSCVSVAYSNLLYGDKYLNKYKPILYLKQSLRAAKSSKLL